MMLDALALGLLLTMNKLLSLVFTSMSFTMRIQWYHHIHTLIMGYAFILFICFVTYEERLMRPPRHYLNRFRFSVVLFLYGLQYKWTQLDLYYIST